MTKVRKSTLIDFTYSWDGFLDFHYYIPSMQYEQKVLNIVSSTIKRIQRWSTILECFSVQTVNVNKHTP